MYRRVFVIFFFFFFFEGRGDRVGGWGGGLYFPKLSSQLSACTMFSVL